MSISSYIRGVAYSDAAEQTPGPGVRATHGGSLVVTQYDLPRRELAISSHAGPNRRAFLSEFKTTAGSAALNVNGSVTPVSFRISSDSAFYRHIERVIIYIEDELMSAGGNEIRRFGSAAAAPGLTNGILHQISYSGVLRAVMFPTPVKNIGSYVVFGNVTNVVDGVSAGVDILSAKLDLVQSVELVPEKTDFFEILVQDNLTAVNLMTAYAIGYEEDA